MAGQFLSTRQLNQLRKLNQQAMPNVATIFRRALVEDGNGGKVASYSENGTAACRYHFENERTDQQQGGRIVNPDLVAATFEFGADIEPTDRITIDAIPDATFGIAGPVGKTSHGVGQRLRLKKI